MNRRRVPTAVTYILLAAAIAFCAFGAVRGETDIVLKKIGRASCRERV